MSSLFGARRFPLARALSLAAPLLGLALLLNPVLTHAREELQVGGSAVVVGTGSSGLRVRSGPGMGYRVVATLPEGTSVQIIAGPVSDGDDDWYQIGLAGVVTGWGAERYLGSGG